MNARIGLDHYTMAHRGIPPRKSWTSPASGGRRVEFLEPSVIDPELNPDRMAAFRAAADDMGLYLEVGLPRQSHSPGSRAEPAAFRRRARPVPWDSARCRRRARLPARSRLRGRPARPLPLRCPMALPGRRDARSHDVTPRRDFVTSICDWPSRDADLTVTELLDLLARLDDQAFGVTVDTGNLPMRLDDPVDAVALLAPWALCTHVKDAVLAFTPRGLCWQARPVGSGILPMTDMLAILLQSNPQLNLSIELHPRTYDLPIYDRNWLAHFPELRPASLAAVERLALCEARYAEGTLPRPQAVEEIPWAHRDLAWLASSLGYLRSVVKTLAYL